MGIIERIAGLKKKIQPRRKCRASDTEGIFDAVSVVPVKRKPGIAFPGFRAGAHLLAHADPCTRSAE
jgi:hypothetical protein